MAKTAFFFLSMLALASACSSTKTETTESATTVSDSSATTDSASTMMADSAATMSDTTKKDSVK